jgi:hypothetical protein
MNKIFLPCSGFTASQRRSEAEYIESGLLERNSGEEAEARDSGKKISVGMRKKSEKSKEKNRKRKEGITSDNKSENKNKRH